MLTTRETLAVILQLSGAMLLIWCVYLLAVSNSLLVLWLILAMVMLIGGKALLLLIEIADKLSKD